ncbi:uncharacterized protein LOC130379928 [Gadus chalcogrammus]|uniref:uncharacterized protein LOC130379928 n=1 Tax=Gadus chalcogrammus TaxID=1042646 RepID=UPI0024C3DE61|nr:uncharacterized protein LOC130379928 [Gadus chalcogrammus]
MADFWSEEREENLIGLLEDQPVLYDVGSKGYSNRDSKRRACCDIAVALGVSEKEVGKKIHSLRTQYNRYSKAPAPGRAGGRTGRQDWVLRRLSFLEPYIRKRASSSNVDEKIVERESDDVEGLDEEEDVEVEESSEPEGQGSTCLVPQVQKVAGSKRKRQTEKQEDEVLSAVGNFLRNRTEQREEDTMSIFCKNLEMKMRRIKDPNILLDLEHQLEEACYQASLKDRDNQAPQGTERKGNP